MSKSFIDSNIIIYANILSEDFNTGQFYAGIIVENPFS